MRTNRLLIAAFCSFCLAADAPAPYSNNFEKAKEGPVPEELMVLSGKFAIRQIDGNKVLEVEGTPLEFDGVLFGPADAQDGRAGARIWAASTGRRFPEFGIGSGDVGGYRLWLLPGQAKVEIRRGDMTRASAPYRLWKTGAWTQLRLRVGKSNGEKCKIEGKVWPDGSPEPRDWMIQTEDPQPAPPGHLSLWGTPFSGRPIRFDDLTFNP